jgi:uncharacterized protein (TIGR03000 family)
MSRIPRATPQSLHWLCLACVGMVMVLGAADDPKQELAPITLTIRLPADAELEILGKPVTGTGELRHESIVPTKDAETLYNFKATWTESETPRTVKKSLRLKPGQEAEVDLNLEPTADEKMILNLINKEREKMGLGALTWDPKLNRAARGHSINMARKNLLAHELDGKGPPERIKEVGYRVRTFGENCGVGSKTPAAAVQMWMNSPPHKENILTGEFTETGIGIATGKAGAKFYTQVFAAPAPPRR